MVQFIENIIKVLWKLAQAWPARSLQGGTRFLDPSALPQGSDVLFETSSFFAMGNKKLPSPKEIRRLAGSRYYRGRPPPVKIPSLNLLVKYGSAITIAEGQCLWAIAQFLPEVPIPEIYGWKTDDGETFIYMQLVEGVILESLWPDLDVEEKVEFCLHLRRIVAKIRSLKQDPKDIFIANINRGSLHDVLFDTAQNATVGAFADTKSFYDWFCTLNTHQTPDRAYEDPFRAGLSDDVPIVFTHNDLHRSNIIVAADGPPKILALIDWHQSGWFPEPWEFFKTRMTAARNDRWEESFITEFLQSHWGGVSWQYYINSFV